MASSYTASDIEVLSGLDPVRRRPGMYTDTTRPNHLAHEVIDNSVDEALAGHCEHIDVTVFKDGSLQVEDDGRGMPVDIHPKEKISGVELILTRLHAGGKFNDKTYQHSGGLHGVGVSVVNALSKHLECWVRRGGKEYNLSFAGGRPASKLEVVGEVPKSKTGTTLRFWPDPKYFDTDKFADCRASSRCCAPRRCCARTCASRSSTSSPASATNGSTRAVCTNTWPNSSARASGCPPRPSTASATSMAVPSTGRSPGCWNREQRVAESYVNLIPTVEGGTHVNGLRAGAADAVREFCEFRNLVPRGLEIGARGRMGRRELRAVDEDARAAVRRSDQGAPVVARVRRHRPGRDQGCIRAVAQPASGSGREDRHAGDRQRAAALQGQPENRPQARRGRAGAAGQAGRLRQPGSRSAASCFWSRATRPADRPSRRATAPPRPSCRCAARY